MSYGQASPLLKSSVNRLPTAPASHLRASSHVPLVRVAANGKKSGGKKSACADEVSASQRVQLAWLVCWLGYTFGELIGTALLVFLAAGATDLILLATGNAVTLSSFQVGAAFTAVLFPLIFTLVQFKSGDFNPAVSVASFLSELFERGWVFKSFVVLISKLVGQFLGAYIGALILSWIAGSAANAVTAPSLSAGKAIFIEILGTATIVLWALLGRGGVALKSLAIAVYIGLLVALFAGLSGGSFNYFRTLGPSIVEGSFTLWWVYLVSMFGGVGIALLLKFFLFDAQRYVRRGSANKKKNHSE